MSLSFHHYHFLVLFPVVGFLSLLPTFQLPNTVPDKILGLDACSVAFTSAPSSYFSLFLSLALPALFSHRIVFFGALLLLLWRLTSAVYVVGVSEIILLPQSSYGSFVSSIPFLPCCFALCYCCTSIMMAFSAYYFSLHGTSSVCPTRVWRNPP